MTTTTLGSNNNIYGLAEPFVHSANFPNGHSVNLSRYHKHTASLVGKYITFWGLSCIHTYARWAANALLVYGPHYFSGKWETFLITWNGVQNKEEAQISRSNSGGSYCFMWNSWEWGNEKLSQPVYSDDFWIRPRKSLQFSVTKTGIYVFWST